MRANRRKQYDIIYSIGYDCSCALYIKKAGLRLTAGPFDWLTHASFEQRFNCLLNDFQNFLNINDLESLPSPVSTPTLRYENKRTGFYFYHDFPKDIPFNQSFPAVAEKYRRRIDRFYKNIRDKEKVLLIFFSQYTNTPNTLIKDLCQKFCRKIGKNIDFLIIEHQAGIKTPIQQSITPHIIKYNLDITVPDSDGNPTLLGDEKGCLEIFKNYTLPPKERIKKTINRFLSKIIVPLIPVKNIKKRIKHQLNA